MYQKLWDMFMITENLPKSNKYILTDQINPSGKKIILGEFESLEDCADFILNKNMFWTYCYFNGKNKTTTLCEVVIKKRKMNKKLNDLNKDFL